MRTLEIRRHSMRARPGQHLTQEGVTLARRVGATMGPFHRVITSTAPRAFETAIAMGFAVDEQIEELGEMGKDVDAEIGSPTSLGDIALTVERGGTAARFARKQARLWHDIAASLPEGGAGLIISHGGIIELGAIGCLPQADHAAWGPTFGYCEGVRLTFDGQRFIAAEILRVV